MSYRQMQCLVFLMLRWGRYPACSFISSSSKRCGWELHKRLHFCSERLEAYWRYRCSTETRNIIGSELWDCRLGSGCLPSIKICLDSSFIQLLRVLPRHFFTRGSLPYIFTPWTP